MFRKQIINSFLCRFIIPNEKVKYPNQSIRHFSQNEDENSNDSFLQKGGKYKIFKDEEAPIILDVDEERLQYRAQIEKKEKLDEFEGINLTRGKTGVFDIMDLIDLLKKDKVENIFVVDVPKDLNYVDYLVVCNGKSQRHLLGTAEFVRRVFKKKMNPNDIIPRIEGEKLSKWLALDLGNIALHLMTKEARVKFDLESLWAVGSSFDDKTYLDNNIWLPESTLQEILDKHSISLDQFHPSFKLS